jgi:hypothetical protein
LLHEREREREREWIKRGLRILQYYYHCKCVDANGYLYVFEFQEGWEVFLNAIVEVSWLPGAPAAAATCGNNILLLCFWGAPFGWFIIMMHIIDIGVTNRDFYFIFFKFVILKIR